MEQTYEQRRADLIVLMREMGLTDREAHVYVLYWLEQREYEEVGAILSIASSTARVLMGRARQHLGEHPPTEAQRLRLERFRQERIEAELAERRENGPEPQDPRLRHAARILWCHRNSAFRSAPATPQYDENGRQVAVHPVLVTPAELARVLVEVH